MKLSDLDYPLSKEKIALFPTADRSAAKLLCVDRASGACSHKIFRDLSELLKPGDVLVLNDTKVLPARLLGEKSTGGKIEALLLKELEGHVWESLLKPGGRVSDGSILTFSGGGEVLRAQVLSATVEGTGKRLLAFQGDRVKEKLRALGHVPLPPYINRPDQPVDHETYQTVFAKEEGAVAAPTAGLHFDKPLLEKLTEMGVEITHVTLHVSYGTFQPITADRVEDHRMFEEEYEISEKTAHTINAAKRERRRIIVCGTTCVRALESAAVIGGQTPSKIKGSDPFIQAGKGKTSIFIYPPYTFRIVDGLITNFHMPKSTLLAMVAAFLGYEKLMAAYNIALHSDYRFASYGDAMFIS